MPDSMYDKLGELRSEALDSGNFFYENPYSAQNTQQKSYEKEKIIAAASTAHNTLLSIFFIINHLKIHFNTPHPKCIAQK